MRVSTRARYGLRILIELARLKEGEFLPLREIGARLGVSKKYLERIVRILEAEGIIIARKGVKGGYRLRIPTYEINLFDLLSMLEGKIALSDCLISGCQREEDCLASRFWLKLGQSIRTLLNRQSLADVLEVR